MLDANEQYALEESRTGFIWFVMVIYALLSKLYCFYSLITLFYIEMYCFYILINVFYIKMYCFYSFITVFYIKMFSILFVFDL